MIKKLLFTVLLVLVQSVVFGATISSTATGGNWSAASTWAAVPRTGTISTTSGSINVTGVGTSFLTELAVGSILKTAGGTIIGTVATISSNTALTLVLSATSTYTGIAFTAQVVPTASDDVVISTTGTNSVIIISDVTAKSLSVFGTLTINNTKKLTVFSNIDVASGASFNAGLNNSDDATILVYGDFTNNGTANFWKSTVVIAGNLYTASTILQNNGDIVVGGNVTGTITGSGTGLVYPINTSATVSLTAGSDVTVKPPGTLPPTGTLLDLTNEVIYGGTCSFIINNISSISACSGSTAIFTVSVPSTVTSPSYQWQVNENKGSGWVNLNNVAPYSGVITSTLTISGVVAIMNNYKYRAKVSSGGCSKSGNYGVLTVIAAPTPPSASVSAQPTCTSSTGTITITVVAGMNYSIDGSTYTNTSGIFTPVASGTYSVTAKNSSGCISSATSVTINAQPATPVQPILSLVTQPSCTVAIGSFTITNYNSVYTYEVNPSTGVTVSGNTITAPTGSYTLKATLGTCTSGDSSNVEINATTNTWNVVSGVGSWTNTLTNSQAITFNGNYDSIGDLTACSCTVNAGVYVNINSGDTLNLTDKLSIATALISGVVTTVGSITFFDKASLVQTNDVENSGEIDYVRTTETGVSNTDYTYWSSPVYSIDQTLGYLSPFTLDGMMYSYNSSIEDWNQEYLSTVMDIGVGYIVRGPESVLGSGIIPGDSYTATFTGVPNNGHYEIDAIADRSYLLGNPYPSALDAEAFLNDNADVLNGTLYFWTHKTPIGTNVSNPGTGVYAYSGNDYATYNATGGVAATQRDIDPATNQPYANPGGGGSAPNVSAIPTGKIASGQGFFASTKTIADGFVSDTPIFYENTMRVGVNGIIGNNSQFFKTKNPSKSSKTIEKNRIWLNLTNTQGAFKQTLIGYITDATNDYDDRFDGESYDGNEFIDFYSVNQDKNLVIQGRALPFNDTDEVPLGFRTTINGAFTINIDQIDGLLVNQAVFIEDKLTNTVTDLKSGNYTFNTVEGTFNDRFVLRYTNTNKTLGTPNFDSLEKSVLVSNKNKQIKIDSAVERIDKVTVFDLLGRQIYQKTNVNSNELSIANLVSNLQMLMVKTTLQNGETVTKKILY